MSVFTRTENGMHLKLYRIPRDPMLMFKIHQFSLFRDAVFLAKKQFVFEKAFKNSPLIVLNNFSGEGMQLKLMTSMFQNMFPTINLAMVNLSTIRCCVCFNYNPETKLVDFRHYAIKAVPVDEDYPANHVTLPEKLSSRGNHESGKSAIRLFELGPRISIQLTKFEDDLLEGEVLFHDFIERTQEEKLLIKKRREKKKKLKENRKKNQEENKKKKEGSEGKSA